jgi:hypothetical protein
MSKSSWRFKGTPYELAKIIGWNGVNGIGIVKRRDMDQLVTPLYVKPNILGSVKSQKVGPGKYKLTRSFLRNTPDQPLHRMPIEEDSESIEVRYARLGFPDNDGYILGELESDGKTTSLIVKLIDDTWDDYSDSDGWAMLYEELKRRNLLIDLNTAVTEQPVQEAPDTTDSHIKFRGSTPLGTNYITFKSWFESYRHSSIDGQSYVVGLDYELGLSYSLAHCRIDIVVDDTSFDQIVITPQVTPNPNLKSEEREENLQTVQNHLTDLIKAAVRQFPVTLITKQPEPTVRDTTIIGKKKTLQTKPAGRPPDRVNDEAYQKLLKRNEQEAFDFWCRKKNIDNPTRKDRQNFKQSMKRAENRNSMTT